MFSWNKSEQASVNIYVTWSFEKCYEPFYYSYIIIINNRQNIVGKLLCYNIGVFITFEQNFNTFI